jgi:hypothetical protein
MRDYGGLSEHNHCPALLIHLYLTGGYVLHPMDIGEIFSGMLFPLHRNCPEGYDFLD